jgi:hypothetical protein
MACVDEQREQRQRPSARTLLLLLLLHASCAPPPLLGSPAPPAPLQHIVALSHHPKAKQALLFVVLPACLFLLLLGCHSTKIVPVSIANRPTL